MTECVVIKWLDVNDKDYNDPSKYIVVNWSFNVNNFPVQGLDSDLEVLVKRTPYNVPSYDSRLVVLNVNQAPVNEKDSEITSNNMWVTSYELVERDNESKKISVDEEEVNANLLVFPTKKQLKYLLMYTAMTRREALGLTISTAQQEILNKGDAIAAKMWQNHVLALAKKADIDAGAEIDLDENWQTDEE